MMDYKKKKARRIMNRWQKVLDIINEVQGTDIAMEEEFDIKESNFNPYKFTEYGFFNNKYGHAEYKLYGLISCKWEISKKPKKWKPEINESYFIPSVSNKKRYVGHCWQNDDYDNTIYENGIICKTKEKAIEMAKKMLKSIESEEKEQ